MKERFIIIMYSRTNRLQLIPWSEVAETELCQGIGLLNGNIPIYAEMFAAAITCETSVRARNGGLTRNKRTRYTGLRGTNVPMQVEAVISVLLHSTVESVEVGRVSVESMRYVVVIAA